MSDIATPPSASSPPPTDHSARPPFRLRRARTHKMVGGVAAGVGRAAGVEPTLARVAFIGVLLAKFDLGLVAYIVACLVIPQEDPARGETLDRAPEPLAHRLRLGLLIAGVWGGLRLLGGISGALFASAPEGWTFGHGYNQPDHDGFFSLLLIGGGLLWLLSRHRPARSDGESIAPRPSWEPTTSPVGGGALTSAEEAVAEERAKRNTPTSLIAARVFGWLVVLWAVAVALLGFGLWWAGALRPGRPDVAIPLGVLAFGALLFALYKSRRPLTILLAVAALAVPFALASRVEWFGGAGIRDERVNVSTLLPSYRLGAGQLALDMRGLEVVDGPRHMRVDMGVGEAIIRLPRGVAAEVTGAVRVGAISIFGQHRGGTSQRLVVSQPGCPGQGRLLIDVSVRVGHIQVDGDSDRYPCPPSSEPVAA